MVLIPYEVLTLKTNQSIENVRKKLNLIVSPNDGYSSLGFNRSIKPFIGEINQNDFKFIRGQGLGFNKIAPLVFKGTLIEKPEGTELKIKIRFRIWENAFLILSILLFIIFFLESSELGFPLLPLLFYLIYLILFKYYFYQSKKILARTFSNN